MKVNIDRLTRGPAAAASESQNDKLIAAQRLPKYRHIRADLAPNGARQ